MKKYRVNWGRLLLGFIVFGFTTYIYWGVTTNSLPETLRLPRLVWVFYEVLDFMPATIVLWVLSALILLFSFHKEKPVQHVEPVRVEVEGEREPVVEEITSPEPEELRKPASDKEMFG